MKKSIIITTCICLAIGCANNQRESTEMTEDQFQQYSKQKNEEGMIAIETTFVPTLKLTNEIKNTSLEDLIRQKKGKLSKFDQTRQKEYIEKMKQEGYSEEIIELLNGLGIDENYKSLYDPIDHAQVNLKFVPVTSNLAKVYYLEDMGSFIERNKDYYKAIINKMQEENQKNQEQKNWDKYL